MPIYSRAKSSLILRWGKEIESISQTNSKNLDPCMIYICSVASSIVHNWLVCVETDSKIKKLSNKLYMVNKILQTKMLMIGTSHVILDIDFFSQWILH